MTMIWKYLSEVWTAVAPAVGNHLWQSTLLAVVAGLLTLILRKNHARARYWLWLAASLKFLIPFSLLVGIGSHLGWSHATTGTTPSAYFALEEISQPFTQSAAQAIPQSAAMPASQFLASFSHLLPLIFAAVWLCGFLTVVILWSARWRRMSAAIRLAVPLREGREVRALRRVERSARIRKRIDLFLSRASLEPGIFGIARPVLVWPVGISDRLEDVHVEAILAHEVWHVRRRDNLAAAIHMIVEAVFWFHPLVWWLGARLVEERECACDEEVLELGSNRQAYAESILKICEFCIGPPLPCVSGVTGADLKKRIVHIMTNGTAQKLNFSKKFLLGAAGVLAIAVPVAIGAIAAFPGHGQSQAGATPPAFDVASVKRNREEGKGDRTQVIEPGKITYMDTGLGELIAMAYGVKDYQVAGPDWIVNPRTSDRYDVIASAGSPVSTAEVKRMLQPLLAERFHLAFHREMRELPVYALVVDKNGPKIKQSADDGTPRSMRPDGEGGFAF
ncbi:MAG TPA: M56 family metallopeptidase, partial [Candidatus Acidoferrum sp.]|nr:M56 family metallopeptidase [Candidatus Acidoferrum sp.]